MVLGGGRGRRDSLLHHNWYDHDLVGGDGRWHDISAHTEIPVGTRVRVWCQQKQAPLAADNLKEGTVVHAHDGAGTYEVQMDGHGGNYTS